MKFGKKYSEAKDDFSGGNYLRSFKEGESTVRFLQEQDDWTVFREHFTVDGKSFPCWEEDKLHCPGCSSDNEKVAKSSRRYACYVYRKDWDAVVPYRIPVVLARRLTTRFERNDGSATNRDYTVIRTGKGLDTDYDVEQEDKYAVDIEAKMTGVVPIEDILEESFIEVWGADWQPGSKTPSINRTKAEKEQDDIPPSEPDASSDDASGDEEFEVNEDALYEMTLGELLKVAEKAKIDVPSGARKSQVLKAILASAS